MGCCFLLQHASLEFIKPRRRYGTKFRHCMFHGSPCLCVGGEIELWRLQRVLNQGKGACSRWQNVLPASQGSSSCPWWQWNLNLSLSSILGPSVHNSLEGIRKVIIKHGYSRCLLSWHLGLLLLAPLCYRAPLLPSAAVPNPTEQEVHGLTPSKNSLPSFELILFIYFLAMQHVGSCFLLSSCPSVCDSLRLHGLLHAKLPCPSQFP